MAKSKDHERACAMACIGVPDPRPGELAEGRRAIKENIALRALLADAEAPCIYCGRSRNEVSLCDAGLHSCERLKDLMVGISNGVIGVVSAEIEG